MVGSVGQLASGDFGATVNKIPQCASACNHPATPSMLYRNEAAWPSIEAALAQRSHDATLRLASWQTGSSLLQLPRRDHYTEGWTCRRRCHLSKGRPTHGCMHASSRHARRNGSLGSPTHILISCPRLGDGPLAILPARRHPRGRRDEGRLGLCGPGDTAAHRDCLET